jgi:hypothetical protein
MLNRDRRINLCGLNAAIRLTSGVDRVADVTKGYLHSVIGSMRIYDSEGESGFHVDCAGNSSYPSSTIRQ